MGKLSEEDLAHARRQAEKAPTTLTDEQVRLLRANNCPVGKRRREAAS